MPCDSIEEIGVERCSEGVESIQLMSPRAPDSLENLKALATGRVRPSNLRELTIFKCHQIKQIFPPNQLLPNLLLIEIEDCYTLQEIFAGPHYDSDCGDENMKVLNLPKLSRLKLVHLPKLRSICGGCLFMSCDSIEEIHIARCRNLTTLPLLLPSAQPSLKRIFAGRLWWESLQWEWEGNNSPSKHALEPFLEFHDQELRDIGRIRRVFWAQEAPHGLKMLLWRILFEDLNNFGGTCSLCQRSPETPMHLLLFCDVSRDIWFRILGISVEPWEDLHSFDWLDALLFPPNWMLGRKGATSADVLLFVLALADKLYAARNEVIHGSVNLDLSSLVETIEVSFNCLKWGFLHAKSQSGKIPSSMGICINFDASITSSYSIGAVVVSTSVDPCIHMEIMRIDTTDTEVAQANAAWMAATISLRWPDHDLIIYGNNMNIINAVTRVQAPCCQSTSKIISYIHDLFPIPSKENIVWIQIPLRQLAAHALATWAAAVNFSGCAMDIMNWNFMQTSYLVPNEALDEVWKSAIAYIKFLTVELKLRNLGQIRRVFWAREAPHALKMLLWKILFEDLNNFGGTCSLCQRSPETPEHLLLFCDVSRDIWFRILGIRVEPWEDLHSFDWLDALLFPPCWMLGRKGATSADALMFVLALADKLYAARNEVIHGNVNLDLSSLVETIEVSFTCLKRGFLHAKSQSGKFPSSMRIYINFDASIMSSYSIGAVVVSTSVDPCIHMEIMRIDTTDTEVAQANAAWMAATISLRWPDHDLIIYGNNMNIINAVTRVHAPCCQSTSKIISYIHDLFPIPSKGSISWTQLPVTRSASLALATWAAAVNFSDCAMDIMDWNFMPGTYLVPNEVLDEVRERTAAALVAIDGNKVWLRVLRQMGKDVELLSQPLEAMEFGEKS